MSEVRRGDDGDGRSRRRDPVKSALLTVLIEAGVVVLGAVVALIVAASLLLLV